MFDANQANDSRGVLSSLLHSQAGNVLPILAAAIIPLAGLIGGGADVARIYMTKTRLQQACDSGALAGRKVMGSDAWTTSGANSSNAQAQSYFKANFDQGLYGTKDVSATYGTVAGGKVTGSATATLPMTVMQLFNQKEKTITVNCDAALNLSNTDIMFVLDTTGSMNWCPNGDNDCDAPNRRIDGLQTAVMAFYDTLEPTVSADSALRYGFVPFSANVNVGKLLYDKDPSWFKTNAVYQSRSWETSTVDVPIAWGPATTSYGSEIVADTNASSYNTITTAVGAYPAVKLLVLSSSGCTSTSVPPDGTTSEYDTPDNSSPTVRVNATTGVKTTTYTTTRYYQKYQYRYRWTGGNNPTGNKCRLQRRTYQWETDTGVTLTQQPTTWGPSATSTVWRYEPVAFDTTTYLASIDPSSSAASTMTGQSGTTNVAVTSRWNGCMHERQTVAAASFSPIPDGALDLDLITVPSTEAEKWAPAWGAITYDRGGTAETTRAIGSSQISSQSGAPCPSAAKNLALYNVSPESGFSSADDARDAVEAYVNALTPTGNTYHDIGMIWGGRLLSPIGLFADENALTASGQPITRHLVFMTDGELAPSETVYGMYGVERMEERVVGSAGFGGSSQFNRHAARLLAACQEVRDLNITIWFVGFGTGLTDDFYTCAGDDPADPTNAKHTFAATTNAELAEKFTQIAANIAELRLEK